MKRRLFKTAIWGIVLICNPMLGDDSASSASSSCSSSGFPDHHHQQQAGEQGECRQDDLNENLSRKSNNNGFSSSHFDLPYDPYHCPRIPPPRYPVHWNAPDVLTNWPIHQTALPPRFHQALCVLDYKTKDDEAMAMNYLNAEVPFVLRHLPDLDATARKWQQAGYLEQLLGRKRNKRGQIINATTATTTVPGGQDDNDLAMDDNTSSNDSDGDGVISDNNIPMFLVHKSPNYKFMYWKLEDGETVNDVDSWSPPTETMRMSFDDYRKLVQQQRETAASSSSSQDSSDENQKDQPHYYLYADGFWTRNGDEYYNNDQDDDAQLHHWHLFHELPRFLPDPTRRPDVFQELVNGETFQKLLCKVGTRGNHAAMHFDQGRNTIVLLTGRRRYLLAPPQTCRDWQLSHLPHPSYRHSTLDFENPASWNTSTTTTRHLPMNEVILEPGDVLILPSYWFHSVVLLEDDSAQCNGWSTATTTYRSVIESCGSFLH